jgi:Chondroitinase B
MRIIGKHNETILKDKTISEPFTIENCVDCKILNCDFQYDESDTTLLTLKNCVGNTISNCKFHDKTTKGLFVKIVGERTKDNIFEFNQFYNHTFNQENGGEPVRIGASEFSGCFFSTVFRYNHFHDLKADVETVSIKSCGNLLYRNQHGENNQSSFVIRHGYGNKIIENLFKGSGGIRVYGKDNEIRANYHLKNTSNKFPPLIISNGDCEDDPNLNNRDCQGTSHSAYACVKNNIVEGNVYDECAGTCIVWGRRNSVIPINNKVRNNVLMAEYAKATFIEFSAGAAAQGNQFSDNIIYGGRASYGEMPSGSCERIGQMPKVEPPKIPTAITVAK